MQSQPNTDGGNGAPTAREKEGSGAGDTFAHLYESVKKKAEGLNKNVAQPGFESVKRMAERAEGRVVPGGYAKHPSAGGEKRGLVRGGRDGYDEEGDGGVGMDDGPSVDDEWSEWDRTGDGRRGRTRLSGGPSVDDDDRRFDRMSTQPDGYQRL